MTDQILVGLADASIRGTAVVLCVALILVGTRTRSARARYRAWMVAIAAMLLMPALSRVVPAIEVSVPLPMPSAVTLSTQAEVAAAVRQASPLTASSASYPAINPSGRSGRQEVISVPSKPAMDWRLVLIVVYAVGVLVLAIRIAVGMVASHGLASSGKKFAAGSSKDVRVSDRVSVPVTVGILRPTVLLPRIANAWDAAKLDVVLAHERAHIDGRHLLGVWLASINRAIFWFNPVTWWIERRVRTTAEQEADAAATRVAGSTFYARVLLDIAEDLQRAGRPTFSHGLGVDGRGSLARRIESALRGNLPADLPPVRQTALTSSCIGAILFVAACQQQPSPAALQPDPAITALIETQSAARAEAEAARAMTENEVAALEQQLAGDPENAEIRRRLLIYYTWRGDNTQPWADNVVARRRHALWLVEHHPDSELMSRAHIWQRADPEGYAAVRRLWMTHIEKPDASVRAISNAASFFQTTEKPVAEALLFRARSQDPDGPSPRQEHGIYSPSWADRLGVLYAQALVGSVAPTPGNVVRESSLREAHSAYADDVRRKLADSTDVTILASAGSYLIRNASGVKVDFDHIALGHSYLERVLQMNPNNARAQNVLRTERLLAKHQQFTALYRRRTSEVLGGEIARKVRENESLTRDELDRLDEAQDAVMASLPDAERLGWLREVMERETLNSRDSERLERQARELLALADGFRSDPRYASAAYRANSVLAMRALRNGNRDLALEHVRRAVAVPLTEAFDEIADVALVTRLANALLDAGERESVAEFLERTGASMPAGELKDQRLKDAAAIRAGRMPLAYQYAKRQ